MNRALINYPEEGALRQLKARFPGVEFTFESRLAEQCRLLPLCDALISQGRLLTPDLVHAALSSPRLRWIQVCSAGFDGLASIKLPRNIRVSRGGGMWNAPVAEHALAMMLALARHLPAAERERAQRHWNFDEALARIGTVEGRRLLVLGMGEIGTTLARRAAALGMTVRGIRRRPGPIEEIPVFGPDDLRRLLPLTDILAITLPGGAATRRMIGRAELDLLPRGAVIINVGRGSVVDTDALTQALRRGHLGGAGLDVTEPEPLPSDHPLWSCDNVIVTPHIAGDTPNWPEKVAGLVERNLLRFIAGQTLEFEVTDELAFAEAGQR
ncbi:MAG: D-2-hydroxyacid dehydrogenase [Alphaproteobacteria bacterium]|nr:D-2-hydroxyacid dehydrogenase [Alphaproteobacteria bacterium]